MGGFFSICYPPLISPSSNILKMILVKFWEVADTLYQLIDIFLSFVWESRYNNTVIKPVEAEAFVVLPQFPVTCPSDIIR